MKKIAISFPSFAGMRQGFSSAAGALKNEVSGIAHHVSSALPNDVSHVTPGHVAEGIGNHLMGKLGPAQHPIAKKVMGAIPKVLNAGANLALGVPKLADLEKKACIDELSKLGAISDEQAAKALERYENLEQTSPTPGQVARYSALGALTAPAAGALSSMVSGQPVFGGGGLKQRLRGAAGAAVGGALGMGAMPLIRQHLDRRAEMGTLKSYMDQPHAMQDTSSNAAGKLSAPFEPVEKAAANKTAFEVSQYSGPMGPVFFRQHSQVPPMKVPSLQSPVQKTAETAITPAGRLSSSTQVGLPKITAPAGPSIAQVAKPVGFGKPLPGANKTGI